MKGTWEAVILMIRTFFKAKNSLPWILNIKIKINMTWVSKEYETKTKMEQGQWLQLKSCFYWVITWKLLLSGGGGRGNKNLVRGGVFYGKTFLGGQGGGEQIFDWWRGGLSPIPPSRKSPVCMYTYIYIHMCSLRSWNNTSYAICWDKFLAFLHQQKFTKLFKLLNF